ncbi:GDSL esterase/lipase LTL1-like [Cynara cardunculus var. scolymus]|uniref:GDSL esterase/lipase LTL1-like n=1 Tax=Cynara cardunculus var. scolymus TaxID=59895 RepID=UPI000D62C691|nr:GDSL esterase/lipase LTL1-like [Cynara cardunculus var. scolymus]
MCENTRLSHWAKSCCTKMASSKSLAMFCFLLLTMFTNVALKAHARAFFVFGDSLVDNGNNNFLATTARADNTPYGIDYPTKRPTGRFSNGLNIPDLISESIGSESTLPYLSPALTGQKLLVGANFASAGVGVLNDTGVQFANIIRMPSQMAYLEQYKQRVSEIIGPQETERLITQSLTLMTLGGNDFVNNYYLVPFSARSRQFALPDYVVYVVSEYRKILKRLHELGLRRVLVTGTGPLGCVPAELAQHSRNGECWPDLQAASGLFNPQLQNMLDSLNREVGSTTFIGVNIRQSSIDFISNPAKYGFVTSKVACCGQGPYNGIGLCTPASNLCPNRDIYAFWDPFHPSEKANRIIVQQIIMGSTEYMSPMNLSTIMALDAAENV